MAPPRPDLRIETLASHHDRDGFSCGVDSLDRYLRTQASQDVRRKANGVFILVEPDKPDVVLGYYTLCATALLPGDVPPAARKHVPRYPLVSATLIGRLAVSDRRQGERLGAVLLADAVQRAFASAGTVGSSMLVVEAINERAAAFYEGNGFVRLPDSLRLVLPMHAIQRLVKP
ncbi:Acetyltransferase (GNAT) family protein [Enhydrobacter aerosaccus]|uniref:Acetyltransferase (GNAT) family protein n=1 Tax=Enhydrobacter aerosaccus TaxID=225324 RepID=A0A1T4SJ45_9HYPH|nr:Acetyltransferase (GNAT) family protein [Enhydrobacter aerosaccus]